MSRHLKVISTEKPALERPVALEIDHLQKIFDGSGNALKTVLQDVSFEVKQGELICLLGRSGCGKTTLLNLLAGFMTPTRGQVKLNGQPVRKPGPERCVVFQEDALFPWLTVRENIAFGLTGQSIDRAEKENAIDRFLDLVGLTEFAGYLPSEISGGMKQRVALARVLILQPQVLLMDEPFAALDAQTREEMQALVLDLWSQLSHTILFVTHDVTEAVLLADRVVLMDKDPGCIKDDISIDLSRPRSKDDPAFSELCQTIRSRI